MVHQIQTPKWGGGGVTAVTDVSEQTHLAAVAKQK